MYALREGSLGGIKVKEIDIFVDWKFQWALGMYNIKAK